MAAVYGRAAAGDESVDAAVGGGSDEADFGGAGGEAGGDAGEDVE